MSALPFSFDGTCVRVMILSGAPWWVAADIASTLGYSKQAAMTRYLADDEKGVSILHTLGGPQEMTIISESGLFAAILRSRQPRAKRFRKWVTAEVLPAIRRTGAYSALTDEPRADDAPCSAHVEADEIVSAGRAFRSLFTTARQMGMARPLAATRANQATRRTTGVDLAAELGAARWLESPDLDRPTREFYCIQTQLREHLAANDWPQDVTTDSLAAALSLPSDRARQTMIGQCMRLLGYSRVRLAKDPEGRRAWAYRLPTAHTDRFDHA
ncbi:Bro-N domain-containing protein [Pseudomonas aeruginosa]|uniref:BRO-N domain-containing protein n=1 Tax=Pseudomonas aeruginosa TaxID=287 RepID=UPI00383A261A